MTAQAVSDKPKGLVTAGAGLVWRRRNILWRVFAANILLSALGTVPAAMQLKGALGHSLAGEQLFRGFDLGMFYELVRVPEVGLLRFTTPSYMFAGLFALFMLFVSGGIIEVYRCDRRLGAGEFFAASATYFWRFVRLALLSLILFALLGNAYLGIQKASEYIGDRAVPDQASDIVWLAGVIVLVLIALFVRLWFDIAKVRAVVLNEHRMLRNTLQALDLATTHARTLLWMYVRISLVAWISLLVAFLIWTKLPPTAVPVTLVLLQLVLLVQLAARLWQMASVVTWYTSYAAMVPREAVELIAPPQEVMEPEPQLPLYPDTELPSADG